jgi:hypothetical protein
MTREEIYLTTKIYCCEPVIKRTSKAEQTILLGSKSSVSCLGNMDHSLVFVL